MATKKPEIKFGKIKRVSSPRKKSKKELEEAYQQIPGKSPRGKTKA